MPEVPANSLLFSLLEDELFLRQRFASRSALVVWRDWRSNCQPRHTKDGKTRLLAIFLRCGAGILGRVPVGPARARRNVMACNA